MKYDYVVTLKKSSEKQIDTISIFLCIFSVIVFLSEQIREQNFNYVSSIISVVIIVGIIYNLFFHGKEKTVRYKNFLFLAGIAWISMPFLKWISIVFFVLAFLEYQAKHPLEIGFAESEIVMNTFIRKKYLWSDFNNIILKDDLLTLDFKNNKIFQKETIEDDEPDADEDEFNDYCKEQLKKANNHTSLITPQQLTTD